MPLLIYFLKVFSLSQFILAGCSVLCDDSALRKFSTVTCWLHSRGLVGTVLSAGRAWVNAVPITTELTTYGKGDARK